MGASWGAQTGPHSGPPWGAVRGRRARARPPAPHSRLRCLSPSAGSKQLFSVMAAGCTKGPLSRARLCSQLCSGVPSAPEAPQGGTRGPRAQAACSTPGGSASPGRHGGVWIIPQLLWHRASAIHLPQLSSSFQRTPKPSLRTPTVKHSGHGLGREGQQGPQWASGLGQALPLITSRRSEEEAGRWPGPRTAVQTKPTGPRPPKSLFSSDRRHSSTTKSGSQTPGWKLL